MSRRRFLVTTAAVFVGMLAQLPLDARAADKVVRVMTFGSTWEKVLKPMAADFKAETGYEIQPIIENSSAEGLAKLQASRADPGVDVWFTGEAIAMRAATDEALFAPLPKDEIPHLAELMPGAVSDKFVAYWYFPTGIVYRPDLVPGGKVTSWRQLFEDPAFKNKVAMPMPTVYPGRTILIANALAGGTIDDVAPGLAYIGKHRDQIAMFHSSDTAARKALAAGEIVAMLGSPSAVKELGDQKIPVAMVSPKPTPLIFEGMMVVRNGDIAAAATFIDHALSAKWQAHMTKVYNLAPVNKSVAPAEALTAVLPGPEDALKIDEAKVNAELGAWSEKFNAEIAK